MALSFDLLLFLRILTLLTRLALAAALLFLLLRRGNLLAPATRAAWSVVAAVFVLLAFDNAVLELLGAATRGLADQAPLERFRILVYHLTYLLHAATGAALPVAVGALLLGAGRERTGMRVGLAAIAVAALAGLALGALRSWDVLLGTTQVLSFLGIAGYLGFWALLLLGRVPRADAYLAGFLAIETLFVLLLPVQEVFFRLVGREGAAEIWHMLQFLQFATGAGQLVVVLALLHVLAHGRPVRAVPLAVSALSRPGTGRRGTGIHPG